MLCCAMLNVNNSCAVCCVRTAATHCTVLEDGGEGGSGGVQGRGREIRRKEEEGCMEISEGRS